MHNFDDLVHRGTLFTLNALEVIAAKESENLQKSGSTIAVKNLQTIQLQKAILAIGMFSMFDSILQESLSCRKGFDKAKKLLVKYGKTDLHERFIIYECAINILKHGRGRSYDTLISKPTSLPFNIRLPGENFFFEGEISEVSTLIEVNDKFVLDCAQLIKEVSKELNITWPEMQ